MKGSTKTVIPKKRGRPATGKDPLVGTRMPPAMILAVEAWAKKQRDGPGRSEAVRRLVAIGLGTDAPANERVNAKVRAAELAGHAIEKMSDAAAHPEERAQRRRRLTKGPPEFREDRIDQPKPKTK